MNKLNKNRLVHELRFKNGDGSSFSDWKLNKLKSLAERKTAKNKGEEITRVLTNSAVEGILDQRDYFEKDIATKGNLQGYYLVDEGDFVYNPRVSTSAPVGPISKNKIGTGVMSPLYTVFRFYNEDNDFFEQFFKSSKWHTYLKSVSNVGARHDRMSISTDDFVGMPIPCPTDQEEQHKIEGFLSSVDELVTLQSQKLEALKNHKKGLMQQLFPAECETIPKLRFPEFQGDGEWKEKPLKEVFSIFQGFAFSSKDSASTGERWLKIADVSIQSMNHNTPSYLPVGHKDKYKKFSVKLGDYVIALTRPILGKQLKMARVDEVFDGALLNQRVGKLVTDQNVEFVYCLLQTSQLISNIEISISGSEPPNLSAQQIENIKTYIPSLCEQQKIANFLLSIDEVINAQTKKLESLKLYRKGALLRNSV